MKAEFEAKASNVIHAILDEEPLVTGEADWVKLVEAGPLPAGGTYRVKMSCWKHLDFTGTIYMQLRVDGHEVGDVLENSQGWEVEESKTQDLVFEEEQTIELWGYSTDGWSFRVKEFSLSSSLGVNMNVTVEI